MPMSRRSMLAGTVAATFGAVFHSKASAAEYVYKFGSALPLEHPLIVGVQNAADRILEETGGRLKINVFPSSQLGKDTEMLSQLRSGATEFYAFSPIVLSTLAPNAAISGVGFAFSNYDTAWKAMDGELGAYIRGEVAKKGVTSIGKIWDNGFRQITSASTPIMSPDDLQGFKIRVPPGQLMQSLFQALGTAPVTINGAELYTALSTGTVDGQENPLAIISTFKLYEVQKFCALTDHIWDGLIFSGNTAAWERLPADIRDIVTRNLDAEAIKQRQETARLNDTLRVKLTASGMTFTDPDKAAFRKKLAEAGFYSEWKARFGDKAWGILEKAAGVDLG